MEIFSADASQRVLLSPTRIYDPIIGRFLQNEPNQFLRPIAHYLYCRNRPTRKVDPTGLWDENGHFYTTYIVARAAGLSNEQAKALAYFSQLPDEDTDFDATHAGLARAGGIEGEEFYKKNAWRKDVQEVLHSLHGGDSKKRRDCLKKLLLTGNLKDWQKGLVIHAFGDAYAHTTLDDGKLVSYGGIAGHGISPTFLGWITNAMGLGNVFGSNPDQIGNRNSTYRSYISALYGVLKTAGGDPSRLGGLESLADTFTRNNSSTEAEIAALRKLAIERGYDSSYAPEKSGEERFLPFERKIAGTAITVDEIKEVIDIIKKACGNEQGKCDNAPSPQFDSGPSNGAGLGFLG
jgi:RHS repeat-associated protein